MCLNQVTAGSVTNTFAQKGKWRDNVQLFSILFLLVHVLEQAGVYFHEMAHNPELCAF